MRLLARAAKKYAQICGQLLKNIPESESERAFAKNKRET